MESLPSKPIHILELPKIENLSIRYVYNFFVSDESIDESGNEALNGVLSERFLRKGTVDKTNLNSRIPRYIEFDFKVQDVNKNFLNIRKQQNSELKSSRGEILEAIRDKKIITSGILDLERFSALTVSNRDIDLELEDLFRDVLNQYVTNEQSIQGAANRFSQKTKINSNFLSSYMISPGLNEKPIKNKASNFLENEKSSSSAARLNSAFLAQMLKKSYQRGTSLYSKKIASDYLDSSEQKKEDKEFEVTSSENILDVPFISRKSIGYDVFSSSGQIVGVIIEKTRIYNGKRYLMEPIVIASDNPQKAYDSKVAHGQTYEYVARTIAKLRVPVTTIEGRVYSQVILAASEPGQTIQVTLTEDRAPGPPQDVNYYFEYGTESLHITWAPPVNPQRDVKYYQVFRRRTIDEPFELIAHLDFDDSAIRNPPNEDIDPALMIAYPSMPTYFIDSEFNKESSYIYALMSIDARQISSAYSTQIRVSFDKSKNKIKKEFVCYAGSPKQYPNWNLKENFFVDSMKDSGHKSVNIYFNPETYTLIRKSGEKIPAFFSSTDDPHAKYVFQFINADRLLEQKFEAKIDTSRLKADRPNNQQTFEKDDDE